MKKMARQAHVESPLVRLWKPHQINFFQCPEPDVLVVLPTVKYTQSTKQLNVSPWYYQYDRMPSLVPHDVRLSVAETSTRFQG